MEALLIVYLAGTGITMKPLNVPISTMEVCQQIVNQQRSRGHKAFCQSRHMGDAFQCANCNGLGTPIPRG